MESQPDESPLVVIVGPTASGKSALAMALAQRFQGEIISADSRTLYRGMDIGTAKPSAADQVTITHHLLDVLSPQMPITAASFKQQAQAAIKQVTTGNKLPFLVGGTGLYIDAVLYDFAFTDTVPDPETRERLQAMTVEELQAELKQREIPLPNNDKNPRHLVRQLERGSIPPVQNTLRANTLIIGLDIDRAVLRSRISQRVGHMSEGGLEEEVRDLVAMHGWTPVLLQTIGYREFKPYFKGESSLQEVMATIERNTIQYAKRQRTWFRRNKSIHWISKEEEAVDLITSFLNK
jgi:tRNA dimethylallyltransferase